MTKSKTSMVARVILHLTIVTFLDVVVKKNFLLLPVDWYLFRVVTSYRYLPRCSNENALFIISTGNVSVSRWVMTFDNHTTIGICHDSLNLHNSANSFINKNASQ